MGKRGKRSAADLALVRVDGKPARLQPPPGLQGEAEKVFEAIVAACDPTHFVPSDSPLLAMYCEALAMAARASRELRRHGPVVDGKTSPWVAIAEKGWKASAALSHKLRLTPSSRYCAREAGRKSQGPPAPVDISKFLREHGDDGDE